MSNTNALNPAYRALQLTVDSDDIAWVAIDVPDEKMNVLRADIIEEMEQLLTEFETNATGVKGVVIYSAKPDSFIAGADVKMLDACQSAKEAEILAMRGQEVFNRIAALGFPVVSAIHGICLGGGLEFSLACDYRVCSDHDKTRIGLPEVQLGLLPGSGGTQRLPRLVGLLAALDMILTGRQLRAKKALKLGLVDACVAQTILLEVAKRYALKPKRKLIVSSKEKLIAHNRWGRKIILSQAAKKTAQKTRGNYPAANAIIDVIGYGLERGQSKGLDYEAQAFGRLVMTPESKALRSIFFATTEMKKDNGTEAEPAAIAQVAVLGGGLMGAGISHLSVAKAKVPVRIKDVSNDGVLNALKYNYQLFEKQRKRRILTSAQLQKQMMQLSGGTDFTRFSSTDLVIEAVFEDLALKQQMVADMEQHAKPETIFATNTSSLPIAQIAANAQRPENVVGLHYFSPAEKMPLVEVIPHASTSDETIATVVAFARQQGKTPIVVKDKAGFYVNRILAPYMNEAAQLLMSGEPIDVLDKTLLDFGFPVGPITLLDEVGIDIGAKIMPILVEELGPRFQGPEVFDILLNDERKGRKSGKGFYVYSKKTKRSQASHKQVDKSVYQLLKLTPNPILSQQEIVLCCLLPLLNEAVRCLDEGIIRSARDGDIGAIFGIGFPPFLGGPFRYMDSYGIRALVDKMNEYTQKYGDRFAPCDGLISRAENDQRFY